MKISSKAHMGVEILVLLAIKNRDKPYNTWRLAEWINRSLSYPESLMAQLRNAGLVVAQHGAGGGYILARPAQRITVAEVLQAVDASSDFVNRPLNGNTLKADDTTNDLHSADRLCDALKSYALLFLDGVSLAHPESAYLA
ncbi:Rrf2 family transcriptional regulator [Sneathiella sp.]|uniref:RrF2 family transcriptional regulator n=1 Tax=Sneathiella sp. TaxID=1964365 RepID=UPI0035692842